MKYLMLIYGNEAGAAQASPEQVNQMVAAYGAFTGEVMEKKVLLGAERLRPVSSATTVRVRDGKPSTTDGPFAETKEQLAGFYLLDCKDLDEAIDYAAKIPGAAWGSVEVRPDLDHVAGIERVFREESGRIVASLIRYSGSFDLAEEALQDALAAALTAWPVSGIPDNPGAWLTAAARRKLIDELRKEKTRRERAGEIAYSTEAFSEMPDFPEETMPDDRLRLIFTCCHPALNQEAQVALTLRTLGGLTTTEIARSFLMPEPSIAQRLVRAKKKIREAGIPYEVPERHRLQERLESVRTVIYLIFNEGYAATFGTGLIRGDLCAEAIRLGRVLCDLLPSEAENRGLLALMLLQDSRRAARTGSQGELITLEQQDRSLWNRDQIREAQGLLSSQAAGRYETEARIALAHAVAAAPADTDWRGIAALYRELAEIVPSPVIELNRAVAVAMAEGCETGLALIDSLHGLDGYHLFHAARADLLRRLDRHAQSAAAYRRALELVTNPVERDYLAGRLASAERKMEL